MFKDTSTQGKFLVSLFSFIFTVMDDEAKFNARLNELAESHGRRGVKSSEYAFIGEVMFWTLKHCLGPAYDGKTHASWVKIFSKMLKIIVPISVSYELKNNSAQLERVAMFHNSKTPQTLKEKERESGCPFIDSTDNLSDDQAKPTIVVKSAGGRYRKTPSHASTAFSELLSPLNAMLSSRD
jgi:hemoglobin-like flavoprotein